jgi:DNA-binding transcriptional LysR family regulator
VKTELELRHLRVFVAVVEAGAHTRAARSLGLSQSTVSETLSALERTLGCALLRKSGKGLALTPSGEALLPYAKRALALMSELVTEVAGVSRSVSATLGVAAVESLAAYVLPPHLAAFRARWPQVQLEVSTALCAVIRDDVAAGRTDLGLVLESEPESAPGDPSILAATRLVFIGAPGHPLARRTVSLEELRRCDVYMSDAAGNYHQILRRHFEAAELPLPRLPSLGSIEGVKRGVLASAKAVGLLPAHALVPELRDGTIAEIKVTPKLPRIVMRALVAPGSDASPLVEDLIGGLRGSLPGG